MLWQRLLSALILIPFAILVINYGGWPLLLVIALLIGLAQWELNRIIRHLHLNTLSFLGIISGGLFLLGALGQVADYGIIFSLVILLYLGTMAFYYPKYSVADIGVNLLAALYTGWLFIQLYLLRTISTEAGSFFLLFLLVCNWASDTFAYFTGLTVGKTKLAPAVSPKKTVEGAVGGVLGAILIAWALASLAPVGAKPAYLVLGGLISVAGQFGDLAESALKRFAGIKDSSNIIPGHGGILDRFDSVLVTAPLAYYFIRAIILVK